MRFPIGAFEIPDTVNQERIDTCIQTIADFPTKLWALTENLGEKELAKTYRPGGWNVRQVVHHCADSHMNAFIRFKLALTEDKPMIRPYEEAIWAELKDTLSMPIADSLGILKGVHNRWTVLLKEMSADDYKRSYIHPEHGQVFGLDQALANYDWHCKHHFAHIEIALTN